MSEQALHHNRSIIISQVLGSLKNQVNQIDIILPTVALEERQGLRGVPVAEGRVLAGLRERAAPFSYFLGRLRVHVPRS